MTLERLFEWLHSSGIRNWDHMNLSLLDFFSMPLYLAFFVSPEKPSIERFNCIKVFSLNIEDY